MHLPLLKSVPGPRSISGSFRVLRPGTSRDHLTVGKSSTSTMTHLHFQNMRSGDWPIVKVLSAAQVFVCPSIRSYLSLLRKLHPRPIWIPPSQPHHQSPKMSKGTVCLACVRPSQNPSVEKPRLTRLQQLFRRCRSSKRAPPCETRDTTPRPSETAMPRRWNGTVVDCCADGGCSLILLPSSPGFWSRDTMLC